MLSTLLRKDEGSMKYNVIEQDLKDVYDRNIPWEQLRNKTVLITGAYGMLASYVVYMLVYLNEQWDFHVRILAIVRSREKLRNRFGDITQRSYFKTYISSLDQPLDIEENIHFIIHTASPANPRYYKVYPAEVLKPNIIGNYYLLELAVRKKVEGYLFFSTCDIYGIVKDKKMIQESDYGSMDTLDIHNCYGESKRMAETMCRAWYAQKGVPVKIIRIAHTYAPTMDVEHDPRVFASFINDIIKKRDIVMKSDGSSKRTFCYIADALAAFFLVLFYGKSGEAYNVCNTEEFYSIVELAQILTNIYPQLGLKVIREDREKDDIYVENTVANSVPYDNSKLKQLGWKTRYDIRTGFRNVVEGIKQMENCNRTGILHNE